jgi:hypothetical protein
MTLRGHIHNGAVILDNPPFLAEGTEVRVEIVGAKPDTGQQTTRQGGQYAGQIRMAPDFDEWPEDMQEALGMKP